MKIEKVRPPQGTPKQIAVIKALVRRNPDGTLLDIYQLMAEIGVTNRGTMRGILRHLVAHGLVEYSPYTRPSRQGSPIRLIAATQAGIDFVRPASLPTGDAP